jgi:hypothetical protein
VPNHLACVNSKLCPLIPYMASKASRKGATKMPEIALTGPGSSGFCPDELPS